MTTITSVKIHNTILPVLKQVGRFVITVNPDYCKTYYDKGTSTWYYSINYLDERTKTVNPFKKDLVMYDCTGIELLKTNNLRLACKIARFVSKFLDIENIDTENLIKPSGSREKITLLKHKVSDYIDTNKLRKLTNWKY